MKEEGFESEPGEDELTGVEVNIREDVGHDIVDYVAEAGETIQEQGHAFRSNPREETCRIERGR